MEALWAGGGWRGETATLSFVHLGKAFWRMVGNALCGVRAGGGGEGGWMGETVALVFACFERRIFRQDGAYSAVS